MEKGILATEYDLRRYSRLTWCKNCADVDRSWNILHVAANRSDEKLSRLLEKLPREDVDSMLVQQSKPYLNTVRYSTALDPARRLTTSLAPPPRRGQGER